MPLTIRQAFAKYGEGACREAYEMHAQMRDDPRAVYKVGLKLGMTTQQARVAINAWGQHLKDQPPSLGQ